ncbi:MAG: hypothetical protein Q4E86_08910 [Lachnospiraceae bacterium]|nr:hypothetical protein [Lachnospiraceae bacterium]
MISAPHTYSEWVQVLNILKDKSNDAEVLAAMRSGTIQWQSGIAERFAKRLMDTVNYRINAASDKFQKDLNRAHNQERAVVQALLGLRRELAFLAEAINLPVLPDKDRQQYVQLVISQADRIQNSLEESAKRDRSGKMSNIVKNHRVNLF